MVALLTFKYALTDLTLCGFIDLFTGLVTQKQTWQHTTAKRKVTLTTSTSVQSASHVHSLGKNYFPKEKTVSMPHMHSLFQYF